MPYSKRSRRGWQPERRELHAWAAVAGAAVSVIGGALMSDNASGAAGDASRAQSESAMAGIAEQRRQFDVMQGLLKPYVDAGHISLTGQQDLLGLNGAPQQQYAIKNVEDSAHFKELAAQGENAILANASATGGLRGGNVQGALAQFRPSLLNQLIQQQFANLSGITTGGQNAAAGVGSGAINTGNNVATLMQADGAARAGGVIGQAAAANSGIGSAVNAAGVIAGRFANGMPLAAPTSPSVNGNMGLEPYSGGGYVDAGAGGYT